MKTQPIIEEREVTVTKTFKVCPDCKTDLIWVYPTVWETKGGKEYQCKCKHWLLVDSHRTYDEIPRVTTVEPYWISEPRA
jgi:hypothetical protein